jgi:hypothetical protein
MGKLNRKQLRNLIIKEIKKMEEDAIVAKINPGVLSRHDDPGRQIMYKSCSECGSKMYEGDKVCEQCGYSLAEEETRKEYNSLNEGDCGGCGSCGPCGGVDDAPDYSTDTMGMVDVLTHAGYDVDAHKVGNHKTYKGSYMAKSHLYKVNKYAEKLYHMIPDGHNLEDWMRTKLAQIADDIGEVYHALDHDKFEGDV